MIFTTKWETFKEIHSRVGGDTRILSAKIREWISAKKAEKRWANIGGWSVLQFRAKQKKMIAYAVLSESNGLLMVLSAENSKKANQISRKKLKAKKNLKTSVVAVSRIKSITLLSEVNDLREKMLLLAGGR